MYKVINSDCLAHMKTMADNSVDSIVTDPPYEIGMMGKAWDSSGIAYNVEMWKECLRILKPGGHLLAFSAARTYHRMTCAIEDAGFEIRDQLMWVYAASMPKALDVSKAIDKENGKHERDLSPFGEYVRQLREAKGWSLKQLNEAMGTKAAASWWEGRKTGIIPPSMVHYQKLKIVLGMDSRFDELIEWVEAKREVVGKAENGCGNTKSSIHKTEGFVRTRTKDYDITAPATEAAKQWNGWKSSLKPCHEPICMARKPLTGTIASNVLEYGTGALNIDACRVPSGEDYNYEKSANASGQTVDFGFGDAPRASNPQGRFPGNFVHDGSEEVIKLFPNSNGAGKSVPKVKVTGYGSGIGNGESEYIGGERIPFESGSGSAARFFYSAKASQADRDEGLESKNPHISVKPTSLMCWLVKMVTPPNGIVFDPFVGSGSTGKAAVKEGFNFIGTELSPEYAKVAEQRIEFEQQLKKTHLF